MELMTRIQGADLLQRMLHSLAVKRADTCNRRDPLDAQRQIFRELLETAETTQFGRDNRFTQLINLPFDSAYRYYKSWVPIRSYQDFMSDYFYRDQPASSIG